MRKLIFTAVFSLASLASAQSDDENSLTEGGATFASEDDATPKTPSASGKASAPGQQHTVEKGDTLWDLSQKFLGSPWYWPKVWSYNPEIANPHWIYPGNEVRFYGQGEEVPTQVEAGEPEGANLDEGEMYDDKVSATGQIGYRPKNGVAVMLPGFVTPDEVEASGRIYGAFAETIGLVYPNNIYVQFNKKAPKLGETYVIFRNEGEIIHPITLRSIGYFTAVLAEAKVTRIDSDKRATVQIVKQYDEVRRGDLLGPTGEPLLKLVAARPNTKAVKDARLVSEVKTFLTSFGEHQLVIMDKGSDDGVKVGNVFTFWRQNDPLPLEHLMQPTTIDDDVPREDIGQCVAFEVKAKSSLCLVSRSMRELVRGERAEIRVSGGGPRASR